jgi:hypothetical protein
MIRTAKHLLVKKEIKEKQELDQSMGLKIRKVQIGSVKPPLNHIMENLELEDCTPKNMITEWEKTQYFGLFKSYGDAGILILLI